MTKHLTKLKHWLFILFFAFFAVSNLFANEENENVSGEVQTENLATDNAVGEQNADAQPEQTLTEKEIREIEKNQEKAARQAEKEKQKAAEIQQKEQERQEKAQEKQEQERRKREEKEENERIKQEEKEHKRIEKEAEKESKKNQKEKSEEEIEKERKKEEEKEKKKVEQEKKKESRKTKKGDSEGKEEKYYTGFSEGFEDGYGDEYEGEQAQDFGGFYQQENLAMRADSLRTDTLLTDNILADSTLTDSLLLAQKKLEKPEKKKKEKALKKDKDKRQILKIKIPNCYYKNSVVYRRGDFEFTYQLDFFVHYFEHRFHHKRKFYDINDSSRIVAKKVMNLVGNTLYRRTDFNQIIDSIGVLLDHSVEQFLDSIITELNLEYLATGDIKIRHKKSNQTKIYAKINPSKIEDGTLGNITFYTKNKKHIIEHLDASPFEQYLNNDSLSVSNEGAASPSTSSEGEPQPYFDEDESPSSSNAEKSPPLPPSEAVSESPKKKQKSQFPPPETDENDLISTAKMDDGLLMYDPSTDSLYTKGKGSVLPASPLGGEPTNAIPDKNSPDTKLGSPQNTNEEESKNKIKEKKAPKKDNIQQPVEEKPVVTQQPPVLEVIEKTEEKPAELEENEVLSNEEDVESD